MLGAKTTKPLGQASFAEVRSAAHYQASGFAAGMGVDHSHSLSLAGVHWNPNRLRPGIRNNVIDCTNFVRLCGTAQGLFYRNSGCGRGVYGRIRAYYRASPLGPKLIPPMGLPEARLARIADRLGPASSIAANMQASALSREVLSGNRNIHGIFVDVRA